MLPPSYHKTFIIVCTIKIRFQKLDNGSFDEVIIFHMHTVHTIHSMLDVHAAHAIELHYRRNSEDTKVYNRNSNVPDWGSFSHLQLHRCKLPLLTAIQ